MKTMDAKKTLLSDAIGTVPNRKKGRSLGRRTQAREQVLHLKLFLRHICPQCSEAEVAQEVRQLHHVKRVQPHPERHEIEIWAGFPADGLLREIMGVVRGFCCEVAASQVR
jgi:hypothetical protein